MKITFEADTTLRAGLSIFLVFADDISSDRLAELDVKLAGAIARSVQATRYNAAFGERLDISCHAALAPARVMLLGCGNAAEMSAGKAERLGGKAFLEACSTSIAAVQLLLPSNLSQALPTEEFLASLHAGWRLRAGNPDSYRSEKKKNNRPGIDKVVIATPGADDRTVQERVTRSDAVTTAVLNTRALIMAPPNHLTPAKLCDRSRELSAFGVDVHVITEPEALNRGFPGTAAVARGSAEPAGISIMQWSAAAAEQAPTIALAGKGVTYDSGGITPKSASGQILMKFDMGGAAVVIGVLQAVAALGLNINVIGAFAACENMSGSAAFRAGDVLTMNNGATVEVSFPDAEGRLLLADLNIHLCAEYKPDLIVDIATLTYTVMGALGDGCTGLFTDDDGIAAGLLKAGRQAEQRIWRLPTGEHYLQSLDSHIADLKNMPAPNHFGVLAGSASVAAAFLRYFVEGARWAHLDTAAATWAAESSELWPAGPTGEPVKSIVAWLEAMASSQCQ